MTAPSHLTKELNHAHLVYIWSNHLTKLCAPGTKPGEHLTDQPIWLNHVADCADGTSAPPTPKWAPILVQSTLHSIKDITSEQPLLLKIAAFSGHEVIKFRIFAVRRCVRESWKCFCRAVWLLGWWWTACRWTNLLQLKLCKLHPFPSCNVRCSVLKRLKKKHLQQYLSSAQFFLLRSAKTSTFDVCPSAPKWNSTILHRLL